VLKSDSCSVQIPELELELGTGTLGGVYTTVEGLVSLS
jgi:zinc finger protein